ncbi:HET-domain-containing protein, partial [Dendrothele bispora CBS 962.96]
MNECISKHSNCPRPSLTPLPTRVIDCEDPSKPHLFITQGILSPYAALSYVWGSDTSHITLTSNFDTYVDDIDPSIIPKTIRDAITVTHGLGMRYLWVDAFCIIQDSNEDKNRELIRMGQIYRDAYITIIASCASRGNAGILHDRPIPASYATHPRLPFYCKDGRLGTVSVSTDSPPSNEQMKEPVNHRAWCLQERLLSPRKLIYATDSLQYQCQTDTIAVNNSLNQQAVEKLNNLCFSLSDTEIPDKMVSWMDQDWGTLQMEWVLVVSDYTRRSLTQKTDKLPAFAGIAEQFARIWHTRSGQYFAGLWEKHLLRDLLWFREPWSFGWLDDQPRPRPKVYLAPSWSWASVAGHVRVQPPVDCPNNVCEILECKVTLMDERQPYGEVSSGWLKLSAI